MRTPALWDQGAVAVAVGIGSDFRKPFPKFAVESATRSTGSEVAARASRRKAIHRAIRLAQAPWQPGLRQASNCRGGRCSTPPGSLLPVAFVKRSKPLPDNSLCVPAADMPQASIALSNCNSANRLQKAGGVTGWRVYFAPLAGKQPPIGEWLTNEPSP